MCVRFPGGLRHRGGCVGEPASCSKSRNRGDGHCGRAAVNLLARITGVGRGRGTGHGERTGVGETASMSWNPFREDGIPSSEGASRTTASSDFTSAMESESWSEGEAAIPIFYPVPFKEISSMTPYFARGAEKPPRRSPDGAVPASLFHQAA